LPKLTGTDRRSIGKSNQVVVQVLKNPRLFRVVLAGMLDPDPVLRMLCADAVEKITAQRPELWRPHKKRLIQRVAKIEQPEVRWHVAQMFSRLALTPRERRAVVAILREDLTTRAASSEPFQCKRSQTLQRKTLHCAVRLSNSWKNWRAPVHPRCKRAGTSC
jgi:hypothetical protein